MKPRAFTVHGVHQPSLAGAVKDQDVLPIAKRTTWDQLLTYTFAQPLTLPSTLVEGTDTPFFTRDGEVRSPLTIVQEKKRRALFIAQIHNDLFSKMASTIFHSIADPTPLFFGRPQETPDAWRKRERRAAFHAITAQNGVLGVGIVRIPAGTYTDNSCRLLSEIQRHMLEPTINEGRTWTLWTADEVLSYLNQRLAKFLLLTGMIQTRVSINATTGVVNLPEDLIEIKRVAWDTGVSVSELPRVDTFALDHGVVGWESAAAGTPYAYMEEPRSSLSIRVVDAPTVAGNVDLTYVAVPSLITSSCSPLPIPNFFVPFVKYGVMADMLAKEGEAHDPLRAKYCEERFGEGVELGRLLLGVM